ncbi:conserved hypothetical protein [Nitrosopumilaceae archaeon]|nr:hypothetical protein [Nitrosopumilus sp.]CAI9832632.1 conserved hypothetical protein [Nitrosopumilaceae archaeon]MDA7943517.1 hypothetical protein [Nitrosopumilus sp.]MDA7944946.1 hypothetical protein [Nitrosopumilus sp.]MDA7954680.1 hypothetical protein [Nitrosopumilus sp.]
MSGEKVRDAVSVKEHIEGRISECHAELEMLEKNLAIVNESLKGSSFSRASELDRGTGAPAGEGAGGPDVGPDGGPPEEHDAEPDAEQGAARDDGAVEIRGDDGSTIAAAYVTPESVRIVLDEGVAVGEDVPPFRSFFIERVVGGMRGQAPEIECSVTRRGEHIGEITIRNYGGGGRADELLSSAGWSLRRMLEKAGG